MIYEKIYKIKIYKEKKKLYDLGGKELIKLQKDFIEQIKKIFNRNYSQVIKELQNNQKVKFNDAFQEDINKNLEDYYESIIQIIKQSITIGKQNLDKILKREVSVDSGFGLKDEEMLEYAREYIGDKITKIDEYTRQRINKTITDGLEKGYGYNKIKEALKKDYAFSEYRATLIASNEIGQAYVNGETLQFEKYKNNFNERGYKKWNSHRDDRTTELCLENDNDGWTPFDRPHTSGHMKPLRHIGCRCRETYRLFNPDE